MRGEIKKQQIEITGEVQTDGGEPEDRERMCTGPGGDGGGVERPAGGQSEAALAAR